LEEAYEAHENWKLAVERYSTTNLTKPEDKLIALAGIAQLMSNRIGKKVLYVAGMWETYLASQLLWRVNPKYEEQTYKYPQRRPSKWRAPTFSWAAVDSPQGIKCGETMREEDLGISVDEIQVNPTVSERRFGPVKSDCYVDLTCSLMKIKIEEDATTLSGNTTSDGPTEKSIRYIWRLQEEEAQKENAQKENAQKEKAQEGNAQEGNVPVDLKTLSKHKLSNLYLDSPHDDWKDIKDNEGIYCIPAYRKTTKKINQLACLLVRRMEKENSTSDKAGPDEFRRIGVAVVADFEKHNVQDWIWKEKDKTEQQKIRLR